MVMTDPYASLHQTVRVAADGTVTHGMPVPHEGANVECGAHTGEYIIEGVHFPIRCRKRVGHRTPEGQEPHVPTDIRYVAAPPQSAHTIRFLPNRIPAGVDQNITLPHDCANHLPDTIEVLRRGW